MMLNLLEALAGYVSVPTWLIIGLIALFLMLQVAGEIIELCGKVAPGFMKLRKRAQEKREKERMRELKEQQRDEKMAEMTAALEKSNEVIAKFDAHYDKDNIELRNCWMHDVDEDRSLVHVLEKIIRGVREDVLQMRIEAMRSEIIAFASKVADENCLVTREQYRRAFKLYNDYEKLLEENGLENGEIDTNYRIINESYEKRMVNHSFLEDMRGYNG